MSTKKLFLAILLSTLLASVSNTIHAAGKIENPTMEEVTYAIETTLKNAEETLEALNNGADKDTVLALLKKTKQIAKEIEVTRLGPNKMKASSQMKKARSAAKKDDLEKAKVHVEAGVKQYKELRKRFYEF